MTEYDTSQFVPQEYVLFLCIGVLCYISFSFCPWGWSSKYINPYIVTQKNERKKICNQQAGNPPYMWSSVWSGDLQTLKSVWSFMTPNVLAETRFYLTATNSTQFKLAHFLFASLTQFSFPWNWKLTDGPIIHMLVRLRYTLLFLPQLYFHVIFIWRTSTNRDGQNSNWWWWWFTITPRTSWLSGHVWLKWIPPSRPVTLLFGERLV